MDYINIFGVIGEDCLSEHIIGAIQYYRDNPDNTELVVNITESPGGYSSQGFAVYDALMQYRAAGKKLITRGSGFVGSISTVIFCAGEVRELTFSTVFYVHNALISPRLSGSDDLRKAADYLDSVSAQAAKIYLKTTDLDPEEVAFLMEEEYYLSAEDAAKLGFATYVNNFSEVLMKHGEFTTNTMSKKFKDLFKDAFTPTPKAGGEAQALALNLVDGRTANISTNGETPAEGDAITVDGASLADGNYQTQNGYDITVKSGKIATLGRTPVDNASLMATIEELRGELQETQAALLQLARNQVSGGFQVPGANMQGGGNQNLPTPIPAPKMEYRTVRGRMAEISKNQRDKKNAAYS